MRFYTLPLAGAFKIELDKQADERGFFARLFCEHEFHERGLIDSFPQCNISFNSKKGTLRGIHYSVEPSAETKLVRCIRGRVYDVLVDLRPSSDTYLKWIAVELSVETGDALYIPEGIGHGFQTLEENTELLYHMSTAYIPLYSRGVRWNDPSIQIEWPLQDPIISEKDRSWVYI